MKQTYFIKNNIDGLFKIGISKNIADRLNTLEKENIACGIYKLIDGDFEKEFHLYFSDRRVKGEWFNINENDIDELFENNSVEILKIFDLELFYVKKESLYNLTKLSNEINSRNKIKFNLPQFLKNNISKDILSDGGYYLVSGSGSNRHIFGTFDFVLNILVRELPEINLLDVDWIKNKIIENYTNANEDLKKQMIGALFIRSNDKLRFGKFLNETYNLILEKIKCNSFDDCNEKQINIRNEIYKNIISYSNIIRDPRQIVRVSVEKALES